MRIESSRCALRAQKFGRTLGVLASALALGVTSVALIVAPAAAAAPPSTTLSSVYGSFSVPADGSTPSTVTVVLRDTDGNPLADRTIALSANSVTSSITPLTAVTDAAGIAQFAVTDAVNEEVQYSAVDVTDSSLALLQTATVYFTGPVSPDASTITPTGVTTVPIATPTFPLFGVTLTVTLRDAAGLPVPGKAVSLTPSAGTHSVIVPSPNGTTTEDDGMVQFTVRNSIPESVTYTATDTTDGITLTQQKTVSFVRVVSVAASRVDPLTATLAADGVTSQTIIVTLNDASFTGVAGKTVSLSQGSGHSQITTTDPVTNNSGVVRFTVTNTTPERVTYTAKDVTDNITLTNLPPISSSGPRPVKQPQITFLGPVVEERSSVSATASSVPADGVSTARIDVNLRDEAGHAINGKTVALSADGGSSVITALEGTSSFTVSNTVAEQVTYTATDVDDGIQLTRTVTVEFTTPLPPYTYPEFSSAGEVTTTEGAPFSFLVTNVGDPIPVLSTLGLPAGLTFVDNNDGTGTISGTPTEAGTFAVRLVADNGMGDLTAILQLTVLAPSPPACVAPVGCSSSSSTSPTGTAAVTTPGGEVAASATGIGAITAGTFAGNPAGPPTFAAAGRYFDVAVSTPNTFADVTIVDCDLNGGDTVQWWDPNASGGAGAWLAVSDSAYSAGPPACVTITIGPATTPSLAQLTGTYFAIAKTVNNVPTITAPSNQTVLEDRATAALPFSVADDETAAGALVVSATSANQTLVPTTGLGLRQVAGGSWTVAVTPAANANSALSGPATITLTVSDGVHTASNSFVVTVTAVNDPPAPTNDSFVTPEDTAVVIDVLANDSAGPNESTQALAIGTLSNPAHGTVAKITTGTSAGKVRYTPASNYAGLDSFTYQACDTGTPTACATASVALTVTAVNDPPVALPDASATSEDTAVLIDVLANDSAGPNESTQALAIGTLANAAHGTVAKITTGTSAGKVRYTPAANYSGLDSFTYQACDTGTPTACTPSLVVVGVLPVNDAPTVASVAAQSTRKGTSKIVTLSIGDVDDAVGRLVITAKSSNLTLLAASGVVVSGSGSQRSLKLTPQAGKTGTATVTVTVTDPSGATASTSFALTVTV